MKVCIIGVGRFGYHVATRLAEQGIEVLAVDGSDSIINSIRDHVTQAICMKVTDEEGLRSIGVEGMDTVVIAVGENLAQAILITALLKQRLHMKHVIVRAVSSIQRDILELIGADSVILPEQEMGIRLADQLSAVYNPFIRITDQYSVTTIKAPEEFVGKTSKELDFPSSYHVTLLGRKIHEEIHPIALDDMITEEDMLVLAGNHEHLKQITKL